MNNRRLAVLGMLSGALSYFGTTLLDTFSTWVPLSRNSGTYLPGVFFGGLVMAPFVPEGAKRSLRQTGCMALSAAIYYSVVKLTVFAVLVLRIPELAVCAVTGALGGAAVAGAVHFVFPRPVSNREYGEAAALGLLGGLVLSVSGAFRLPDLVESALLVAGFAAWQTGVGFALFRSKEPA